MPTLDPTFGTGGFAVIPFGPLGTNAYVASGVAMQPDGRIVAGGHVGGFFFVPGDFVVARYENNGSLDPTFGSGGSLPGVVITDFGGDDQASCLAIQKDGKIILAGWTNAQGFFEFALARYSTDGTLDVSFGSGGLQTTAFKPPVGQASANAIALEPKNGDIITGGAYYPPTLPPKPAFAIARHDAKGKLITQWADSFGGLPAIINGVAVQRTGEIVVAGQAQTGSVDSFALARYLPNGSHDTSFGAGGRVLTPFAGPLGTAGNAQARAVTIQPDGKILAVGVVYFGSRSAVALARYMPHGNLDPSFGSGGLVIDDRLMNMRAVALDQKRGIIVAGHGFKSPSDPFYHFAVLCFEPNGRPNTSFDPPTGPLTPVAGSYPFAFDEIRGVAIGRDGKIVGAGFAEFSFDDVFALVRYL
jgi:uncharacterized delta-60 repeat protein